MYNISNSDKDLIVKLLSFLWGKSGNNDIKSLNLERRAIKLVKKLKNKRKEANMK